MFLPSPFARGAWLLLLAPLLALLVLTHAHGARAGRAQEPTPQTQGPTPTPTPDAQQPSPTPAPAPTQTPTPTPETQPPTPTPSTTPSPSPTETPTPSPSPAETPAPSPTPSPMPSPAEDEEVERIDTDLTSVLLSALDKKRRFVNTLRAEDVRLLEDGVEQRISSFERETDAPLSLVLLVDTSASQEKVLKQEQEAASAFVRSVLRPARDTAAVLSFTGITRLELTPTADTSLLLRAIDSLKVRYTNNSPECQNFDAPADVRLRCLTGAWDAVVLSVREVLSKTPERTRRAVILLSDGDDTSSRVRLYQAAEYAVRHNTVVYSIGIRDDDFEYGEMRRDFLQSLSDQTGGRAFFPKKPADLANVFAQIEQELRSQYLVTYTSTNRARDGAFRKLRIEITEPQLKKQNLRLLYRQGYYARK